MHFPICVIFMIEISSLKNPWNSISFLNEITTDVSGFL